jgi:hypothetical protein
LLKGRWKVKLFTALLHRRRVHHSDTRKVVFLARLSVAGERKTFDKKKKGRLKVDLSTVLSPKLKEKNSNVEKCT